MDGDSSSQTPSGHSQPSSGNTPQARTSITQSSHSQSAPDSATNPVNAKRRRGLGVVTPNACTECRKKRAKCDGYKPCGRCKMQKNTDCVYEVPVRQSKENLRGEIENMRQQQRSSDAVFAALLRSDIWEEVLRRLRGGQTVNGISEWLNGTEAAGTILPPLTSIVDRELGPGSGVGSLALVSSTAISVATNAFSRSGAAPVEGPVADNLSPLTAHLPAMMTELGNGSTWHFSPHSQAGSVRSDSRAETLSWQADLRRRPHSRVASWTESMHHDQATEVMPRYRGLEEVLSPLGDTGLRSPPDTWTKITGDINLVQHLLALYFCWEYPTFASLSKEHFLLDFQAGRYRYCSPMLVNALLALGCRFSSHPMTRSNPDNPYSSGDHFFKESQRLFNQETDHHSLTTIQALGIMSIREASCGRDSESWYYAGQSIRLAIEMGLHRLHDDGDENELAVEAATFWGAFALDHAWSLATGSLPQCSCFFRLPHKPAIIGDIEASLWVPYTDDGAPLQRSCEQPSNVRSVYTCFCELSELVHQSLYVLHSPGKPVTARDLLSIYTQYLNWYDQIPEVLRLGHNFTPAVLFAHMYYHFAILLLFRPLIRLSIIGSKILPRDVCLQAADAIQGLLTSYSQLYTLQRTPSFVPYFVLTSAIMHLAIGASAELDSSARGRGKTGQVAVGDSRIPEALRQGIADLTQMAPCHHFAEQALNILRYLAKKWSIDVGIEDRNKPSPEEDNELDRRHKRNFNSFSSSLKTGHFLRRWGTGLVFNDEEPDVAAQSAENMENLLFWPFPLQGRPMIPTGKDLEQAGFALL